MTGQGTSTERSVQETGTSPLVKGSMGLVVACPFQGSMALSRMTSALPHRKEVGVIQPQGAQFFVIYGVSRPNPNPITHLYLLSKNGFLWTKLTNVIWLNSVSVVSALGFAFAFQSHSKEQKEPLQKASKKAF